MNKMMGGLLSSRLERISDSLLSGSMTDAFHFLKRHSSLPLPPLFRQLLLLAPWWGNYVNGEGKRT